MKNPMFWIYLIAVLLAYSFTRNVFLSVFLGFLASIVLVILKIYCRVAFSFAETALGSGRVVARKGSSLDPGCRSALITSV
jgi:hypothetical protein